MAGGRTKRPKDREGALVGPDEDNQCRLQGKGSTPKTEDRVYHPMHRRKLAAEAARRERVRLEEANRLRPELSLALGYELITGCNAILEAIWNGIPLSRVLVSGGIVSDERLGEVVRTTTVLGAPFFEASYTELDRMTDGAVHQGAAIEVPPYKYADIEDLVERADKGARADRLGLVVAPDSVMDPHNLGAIMRSASVFGADGVVVPKRRSAGVNATVWKVSTGVAVRVSATHMSSSIAALSKLETHDYFIIGLNGRGSTMIEGIFFADAPTVLVAGSEDRGFARLTRETYDAIVPVPIAAELRSLSVAVATGITLY